MEWHESTVIVGFYNPISIDQARHILSSIRGYIDVRYAYYLTPAVLVEVHPGLIDTFISLVVKLDSVEYCEYNYLVSPSSYDVNIERVYSGSKWSCNYIRKLHGFNYDHRIDPVAGVGIAIAIVDSGLCPHPYLPATSFEECFKLSDTWSECDHIINNSKAQKHLAHLRDIEQKKRSPLAIDADKQEQEDYLKAVKAKIPLFVDEIWNYWSKVADKWHNETTNLQAFTPFSSQLHKLPDEPSFAIYRNFLGFLRRISLESRNFVHNNLNIEDTNGHGTQMAGILSGRPGASFYARNQPEGDRIRKFEVDVMGLVPNAELVILKCYDSSDIRNSNIDALIRALEHAHKSDVDVIYVGLSINPDKVFSKTAITLDRTIRAIALSDIPVVCPAGNRGRAELDIPASTPESISIGGVDAQYKLSTISNWAGSGDELDFVAFSGDEHDKIITTSTDFGFVRISGTSVAAAIATGIIARALSERYRTQLDKIYRRFLADSLSSGPPSKNAPLQISVNRPDLNELLCVARSKSHQSIISGPVPSKEYGWGIIRPFSARNI